MPRQRGVRRTPLDASPSPPGRPSGRTSRVPGAGNRALAGALHALGTPLGGLDDAAERSARAAATAARSAVSVGAADAAALAPDAVGGRFHTNREAARLARAVGARALTVGRDTWFGEGQYRPATADGRALIAHELTHVQQDRPGAGRTVRREPLPVLPTGADAGVGVEVRFDPEAPWTVLVSGHPDPVDVALELYGIALAEGVRRVDLLPRRIALLMPAMADRYAVVPEMLREVHADRFHRLMQAALARDVDSVESTLLETRIDGDDEAEMIGVVRWWSQRKDLLDPAGRSYFDRFLAQLEADAWFRDYGLWESSRTSYLDTLYTEVEERAGELTTLIAQNSVEFGGYEPLRPSPHGAAADEDLVARSAELVLERLEGYTSEEESGTIADVLVGLPPREKAAVLKAIMRRYDEREYLVLGRFGEAWEGGMLYWLFEDLEEEDGLRLAASIKDAGLMEPEVVDALVAGRGWGGKYLPWTTYHGQEAAQFWADTYEESEGAAAAGAAIAGGFASLWTPETAGSTALTLVTAGTAPTVAAMAPRLAQGLLVVGTGITSYQVTIAGQELASGEDAYTGERLGRSERVVRLLNVVSGLLLLGLGFTPSGGALTRGAAPAPDAASIRWRIVGSDPVTGEVIAVGQSVATGQTATIRLNPQTGAGSATNLGTGQVRAIREFELQAPAAGALGGGATTTTASVAATPGALTAGRPAAALGSPGVPGVPAPFAGAQDVADIFTGAQGTASAEALAEDALAAGLVPQPAPEVFYYDDVSGDFLPWYLDAETGRITPHRLQAAHLGTLIEKIASFGYPINQLALRTRLTGQGPRSGKGKLVRLDSYDPEKEEIVSFKVTQLGRIDEWDALAHVQELVLKYPSGAVVADTPSTRAAGLAGTRITGRLILEVPPQLDPIPQRVLDYANDRDVLIRDWDGVELNAP